MILSNGLYGHIGTGPGKSQRRATITQAEQARQWASGNVGGHDTATLERALKGLLLHPDAYSTGYSQARTAREKVEKELAKRA